MLQAEELRFYSRTIRDERVFPTLRPRRYGPAQLHSRSVGWRRAARRAPCPRRMRRAERPRIRRGALRETGPAAGAKDPARPGGIPGAVFQGHARADAGAAAARPQREPGTAAERVLRLGRAARH